MNNPIKIICATLMTLFVSALSHAAEHHVSRDDLNRCAGVSDNTKRLNCYDALAQSIVTTPKVAEAINSEATNKVTTQAHLKPTSPQLSQREQEESFATPVNVNVDEGKATSITLTIAKVQKMLRGEWKITFTNEQVWQQKGFDRLTLNSGQRVVLTKGALSAYYLKKEGSNKSIQVQRVK